MGYAVVLCVLLILPGQLLAAPSISGVSGTVSSGQSVTIAGSGFGSKSSAAPMKWDTFESGTVGQNLGTPTVGTAWDLYTAYDNQEPKYSSTFVRTGSTKSA